MNPSLPAHTAPHGCEAKDHETQKCGSGRTVALNDQERRQIILSAASDILKANGSHAASMDSIAQQSCMSKKTLYQFFPSKKALFETLILERLFTHQDPQIDPNTSPETQLTTIMIAVADHLLDEERLSLMRSIIAATNRSSLVAQFMADLFKLSGPTYSIQNWLSEQTKAANLTIDAPDIACDYLLGTTISALLISQLLQCRPMPPREERDAFIARGVRIFLKGYQATI